MDATLVRPSRRGSRAKSVVRERTDINISARYDATPMHSDTTNARPFQLGDRR
jgi:spore germination protein YaaH